MEGAALAQSCVSLKTVEMNFQFRKEKVENELGAVSMEGAAVALSCVLSKTVEMNSNFERKKRLKIS